MHFRVNMFCIWDNTECVRIGWEKSIFFVFKRSDFYKNNIGVTFCICNRLRVLQEFYITFWPTDTSNNLVPVDVDYKKKIIVQPIFNDDSRGLIIDAEQDNEIT